MNVTKNTKKTSGDMFYTFGYDVTYADCKTL